MSVCVVNGGMAANLYKVKRIVSRQVTSNTSNACENYVDLTSSIFHL